MTQLVTKITRVVELNDYCFIIPEAKYQAMYYTCTCTLLLLVE